MQYEYHDFLFKAVCVHKNVRMFTSYTRKWYAINVVVLKRNYIIFIFNDFSIMILKIVKTKKKEKKRTQTKEIGLLMIAHSE